MSTTSDSSNLSALYKILYPQGHVPDETYQDYPMLSILARDENFYGSSMYLPLKYGNGNKRSSTFSNAQGNSGPSSNVGFTLTRATDYAVAYIDNQSMEASEKDEGAFVDIFKHEVDAAMKASVQSEAQSFAGDGTGIIGQISSGSNVGTATITLADISQVTNFEVGNVLVATSTVGGSAKTGSVTLIAVNRKTGTLTASGNWSAGITSPVAAGDYLAIQGDLNVKPKGFSAWIPESDPGATAFFGVDRTPDLLRLSGVRDDYSAKPIEEALVLAGTDMNLNGAAVDYGFIAFAKHAELENALGSKVQYVDVMSPIGIGFRGVKIFTGKKPVTILADLTCKSERLWMMQSNTWKLRSLKKSIRMLEQDGLKSLRVSNADAQEVRIGGYKQFSCEAPGYNGNFKI
jgi:hypothetical protein